MHHLNPLTARRPYDADLRALMNIEAAQQGRAWLATWPRLAPGPTPVWSLPALARQWRLGQILVKDESKRSALASFKVLGAPLALVRLVLRRHPDRTWSAAELFAGRHADALRDFVVIAATDGNHGRALAAAAQSMGCRCVIVLHAHVSQEREDAIAAFNAEIVRIAGNYDDSVLEAARLAEQHGWHVVSDTSYDGYEDIPRDVMQGYAILVDELLDGVAAGAPCPCSHVILQGGVGGLVAGVVSYFWQRYGAERPRFIVVEPEQADCLYQSALAGRPAAATGGVDSVMAGLACGATSPLAWRFMAPAVDLFMTVTDAQAVEAMRVLAEGRAGDMPIVSGESGAAGMAALQQLVGDEALRQAVGLDTVSSVLLISTEGATAPQVYADLVGRSAEDVLGAQQAWLRQNP